MPNASTLKTYNTFVKGIITEAGPLTYPENASLDEENCVLNRDGSRQRRLGMDFEDDFVLRSVTLHPDDAVASYRWKNASNDTDNQFVCVQAGQRLLVFDGTPVSTSANLIANLNLASYITGKTKIQVANGMGFLFIVGGTSKPLYLSYDPTSKAVTVTQYAISIRDFFGVNDALAVDTRPGTLSTAHNYNLLNQGWSAANIAAYFAADSVYPSNAQQWFIGKDTDDNFDPATLDKMEFGTTPAPKGRFVIDAFARSTSRNAASGLTTASDIETGYPSCVAFAFQRVFYSGVQSSVITPTVTRPNYSGYVFYSRVLRSSGDAGQCYQDADPTSEVDSELVDTDGGYINIPDSGQIYRLISKGDQILVFAEEGIWAIMGDDGGFRGTSFQVVKITSFGVMAPYSVVDTEDTVLYWNRGGIYSLIPDPSSGRLVSKNITETTIQTLYNSIDQAAKINAVGSFDPVNRRVSWMYNDSPDYTGVTFKNKYNKELVLDFVLEAFYKNSISAHEEPSPYISDYVEMHDFLLRKEGVRNRGDSVTKYLIVQFLNPDTNSAAISFGYYRNQALRDWVSVDGIGVSYVSYLLTGDETMGDIARFKSAPYLSMHFKRTEQEAVVDPDTGETVPDNPSGMLVQCRWDWSDHSDSGKWQPSFQAYRLLRPYVLEAGEPINYGQEVIVTRNRITGSGRALRIYMASDGDKDFYLYGWATKFSGRTAI